MLLARNKRATYLPTSWAIFAGFGLAVKPATRGRSGLDAIGWIAPEGLVLAPRLSGARRKNLSEERTS